MPKREAKVKSEEYKAGPTATAGSLTSLSSKPGAHPPFRLKLEQSVELALINSREYQDQRENLYMASLPVSVERFAFAPQFFAAGQGLREWAGAQTPEGPQNNWTVNSNVGLSKLFSTGGLLLMNFANQTVVNLTGTGRKVTSPSTINLDLVQPFFRNGGLAVALEPLTQSERNLLYQIRDFARFRKTFYVAIAGGGGGALTGASFQPTNVIAATTFSPTAGLGGSGLFPGAIPPPPVFGNPGARVIPGQSGTFSLQTALTSPVSGYLATLLEAAQLQVDEYNIINLSKFLKLAKALQEGGVITQLQTDQFDQQLLSARQTLLNDQLQYLQSLDQFKLQLGLPTDLPIELDDTAFRPLNDHFQRYEDLYREFEASSDEALKLGTAELVAKVRQALLRIFTTSPAVKETEFQQQIEARWDAWHKLAAEELRKRLTAHKAERQKLLDKSAELEAKGQPLDPADERRLATLESEIDLGEFESALREYESKPWEKLPDAQKQRRLREEKFSDVMHWFRMVLIEGRNARFKQLHEQWPKLKRLCVTGVDLLKAEVDEAQTVAANYGIQNRLDLMNVRATVVDAWRQLAIFANALFGTLNVRYHLDSTTPPGLGEPFAFGGSRSREELILDTELPLVRLQERNNYRASLINYQRARRNLQRAEDQVKYDIRNEIRLLREQQETYLIQQRQVELAYMVMENALETFREPPDPRAQIDIGTRAAASTTQLINAQTSLYRAQFTMTTIWITYLNTRLDLYRDLELLPLDYRGVWTDEVETCYCPPPAAGEQPGQLPEPRPLASGAEESSEEPRQ
ncbi:hypothetical protein AYO44_13420 [Planctomycetaceae bacterium SCGC AG-212-F19]|nr:hypothetical protein AYO44_13420 [Planctomycetaceae bacterium SCGC AG-212-F19]